MSLYHFYCLKTKNSQCEDHIVSFWFRDCRSDIRTEIHAPVVCALVIGVCFASKIYSKALGIRSSFAIISLR